MMLLETTSSKTRRALVAVLLLMALPSVVTAAIPSPQQDLPQSLQIASDSRPVVPTPDLSAMEEAAQQKVRLAQSTLEEAIRTESLSPQELAEGFGFLGQLYHAYKLLDAAETCYAEASQAWPEDARWHYLLGLARFAKGDLERSVGDFEQALAVSPGDLPTLIRLGNALIELDRGTEAAAYFEQARAIDPDSAAALYGLGKASAMSGDDARAVELFERALTLQPGASIVNYPLGQAYRRLGEREKALEHLRQRGQDEVGFSDPLGQQVSRLAKGTALEVVIDMARDTEGFSEADFLGFVLSQFGEVEGAIEQLEQWLALRGDGGDEASNLQKARIYYAVGGLEVRRDRDERAIERFRQAVGLAPDLLDARIKLGNALARVGDLDGAIAEYEAVLRLESDHVEGLLKRAAARMELEQWEEARVDLERLVELAPERVEVLARLAAVHLRLEQPKEALARYRQALELDLVPRERLQLETRVAELLAGQGSIDESIAGYRSALEIDGAYVPAMAGLAQLLTSLGRFDEAAGLYAEWAGAETGEPRPRLAEATALILGRRYAEATGRLEDAIASFPGVLDFKDVLARHLAACPDADQRDGERALVLALEVFEEYPSFESAETLAMAYAEAGRFTEAVDWQQKLIDEAEAEAPAEIMTRLRGNLERYQGGEPCCWTP